MTTTTSPTASLKSLLARDPRDESALCDASDWLSQIGATGELIWDQGDPRSLRCTLYPEATESGVCKVLGALSGIGAAPVADFHSRNPRFRRYMLNIVRLDRSWALRDRTLVVATFTTWEKLLRYTEKSGH